MQTPPQPEAPARPAPQDSSTRPRPHHLSRRHTERHFWLWVLALVLGMAVLVGGQAWFFLYSSGAELASLPPRLLHNLGVFLVIALLSLLPFLVWGMRVWFNNYVLPLHRMRENVEALLHGTHQSRIMDEAQDPAGLNHLLNALMERHADTVGNFSQRLEEAMGEVLADREGLEALLDAMGEGVVLFDADGVVLRVNHAAGRLFGAARAPAPGQPVTGVVDSAVLHFAMETLPRQVAHQTERPMVAFQCRPNSGAPPMDAHIAPLPGLSGRVEGYVLTISPKEGAHPGRVDFPGAHPAEYLELVPGAPGETQEDAALLDRPLEALVLVVFDTEATGLNPAEGDEIISIGAVKVAGGKVRARETFHSLANPGRPSSPAAIEVHGIGDAQLRDARPLTEVLPRFAAFAHDAVLVGHNVAFDMALLRKHPQATGGLLTQPVLDTMLLSAILHPHQPSHSLDSLMRRFGIPPAERHTALGDALMTANLLVCLLPLLTARGIITLGQALEASRGTPLARLSYD